MSFHEIEDIGRIPKLGTQLNKKLRDHCARSEVRRIGYPNGSEHTEVLFLGDKAADALWYVRWHVQKHDKKEGTKEKLEDDDVPEDEDVPAARLAPERVGVDCAHTSKNSVALDARSPQKRLSGCVSWQGGPRAARGDGRRDETLKSRLVDLVADLHREPVLFEVKTKADSQSVYAAIGQLAVHAPR